MCGTLCCFRSAQFVAGRSAFFAHPNSRSAIMMMVIVTFSSPSPSTDLSALDWITCGRQPANLGKLRRSNDRGVYKLRRLLLKFFFSSHYSPDSAGLKTRFSTSHVDRTRDLKKIQLHLPVCCLSTLVCKRPWMLGYVQVVRASLVMFIINFSLITVAPKFVITMIVVWNFLWASQALGRWDEGRSI